MKHEKLDLFNLDNMDESSTTTKHDPQNAINDEKPTDINATADPSPHRWFGLGAKEVLILAGCVTGGGAYLFWPNSPVQQGSTRFAASPPDALVPTDWTSAYQKTDHETSATLLTPGLVDINPLSASPQALTAFKKEMATILEARRIFAEENREAIGALSERLDIANKQMKRLEQQLGNMGIRLENAHIQPATTRQPVSTPAKKVSRRPPRASTAGYHINTLWQGMAWVSYQGSTYAVREGDTLGGFQIKRIDAEKRLIETSAGLIR